jgi:F-type H+-transporting ATPase subunit gamma
MPSTRDIRRRIKSVKNTAQITKAMQLVAAAKMKKAQDFAANGRPYSELLNQVLVRLRDSIETHPHAYFKEGQGEKTLILVIATDKGLCGALNTNLLKKLVNSIKGDQYDFISVGRKAALGLTRLRKKVIADFIVKDPVKYNDVHPIGKFLQDQFLSGQYNKVLVLFNNFVNTVTQVPCLEQLLPVEPVKLGGKRNFDNLATANEAKDVQSLDTLEYKFEPSITEVFNSILPQYVNETLFQMLLESRASEHSSRMVAMKNASDNAKQIIKELTLEYNKVRQAAITNELLEITTAKMALE